MENVYSNYLVYTNAIVLHRLLDLQLNENVYSMLSVGVK